VKPGTLSGAGVAAPQTPSAPIPSIVSGQYDFAQLPQIAPSTSGGIRDEAKARAVLDRFRALTAKYADPAVAEAEGYKVFESASHYKVVGDKDAHAWSRTNRDPSDWAHPQELMYEITADGKPGRLVGIMVETPYDLGAGKAHPHPDFKGGVMMQHIWFDRTDLNAAFDG
jgi:hypothetical protein